MIGLLGIIIGVLMLVTGFTGRWRPFLAAVFPDFAARLGATSTPKTATSV